MSDHSAFSLSAIKIFARFTKEEIEDLWQLGESIHVRPHAHVIIEGEPTRGLFVIISGQVSVYRNEPGSTSMSRLALLDEGANFGELSLVDQAPRSATVIAETACQLFYLNAESFLAWLEKSPGDLSLRFYRACSEELAIRMRRVNQDYITAQQQLWKHALRRAEAKE
jgi:CRP-like cAMP-binding protein